VQIKDSLLFHDGHLLFGTLLEGLVEFFNEWIGWCDAKEYTRPEQDIKIQDLGVCIDTVHLEFIFLHKKARQVVKSSIGEIESSEKQHRRDRISNHDSRDRVL
jgi:hypothetical protein